MSTKHQYSQVSASFLEGFSRVPRLRTHRLMSEAQQQQVAAHQNRVASAAEFFADLLTGALPGHYLQEALRPSHPQFVRVIESNYPGLYQRIDAGRGTVGLLQESMTTSDFPLLMGDVLDRMLLQRFSEIPQVWRDYIAVGRPLRDFRTARLLTTDGGDGRWDTVTEETGVKYTTLTESGDTITPDLYGKGVRLAWRMLVNDDLDAFAEIPAILGRGGRRTISYSATDLVFNSTGPDTSVVTALSGNPVLSVANLGTAIETFAAQTDSEGEPILLEGMRLVFGPGLRVTANNIANQLTVDLVEAGGTSNRTVRVNNWLVQGLTLVEDPYIPIIATTNGDTSWVLTTNPNTARPVAMMRFLQGFEQPNLYQKAPNTQRVAGGLDPSVGDFDSMSMEYKGLVAFGGTAVEQKAAVGSNGSGS